MAKQLQFRRGNTSEHTGFTGALAEVTVDTQSRELVVHDGQTPGGFRAARKPFGSVADLLASAEASRGVGELWAAGGHLYREAGSGALAPHVVTSGGVKLYRVDDSADATALGAPEAENPAGREAFAPAVVTSMKNRKLRGVTLRDIVGRGYSDRHDAAATISGFIAELAPAGIAIHDPDNLSILCQEPIRIDSGLKLQLGPNTTLIRGFADDSSDTGALLSRADWSVDTSDFVLHGGILTTASPSQTGKLMSIYGDHWEIRGTRFLEFFGGQGIVFGGDDNRIMDCLFRSSTDEPGTGAVRMVGGKRFCGMGLHAFAGDDLFQFVPITNQGNARFNQSIEDSYYIGCHGISRSARVLIAAIAGPQDEGAMTCTVRRVGWIGCSGSGGNRSLTIENTEGDGSIPRQIDDVVVSECSLDGSTQNRATAQDVLIYGSFDGAIGRVTLANSSILGTAREQGITIQSPGAEVVLENVHVEAESSALEVTRPARLSIRDGRFSVVSNGGQGTPHHVLHVTGSAGATQILLQGRPAFDNVPEEKAAIRISSEEASLDAAHLKADKAEGATKTLAVSHGPGSNIYLGEVTGSVDGHEGGRGNVRREQRIGTGPELSVVSGSVTLSYPDHVVAGEAAVDAVVFPAWAGNGQVFTLRALDERPVTLRAKVGNIGCPEDRVLAGSMGVFVGMKIGDRLVEISFANNSG